MSWKRTLIGIGLGVAIIGGYIFTNEAAQLQLWQEFASGSYTYDVLFASIGWAIPGAIAFGLAAGAFHAQCRSTEPEQRDGFIHRHDPFGAFLEHWTATVAMFGLILSGILLGFLFIPRFAGTTETVGLAMNIHWAGSVLLLFAISYHVGGLLVGDHREILPSSGDSRDAIRDIKHYLGMAEPPEAGKYLPIQRVSYLIWGALLVAMSLTGLVKAADFVWVVSGGLKATMTLLHDVFALLTIGFLIGHIAVVLMPSHLQLLRSQITGWIPVEYVRKHHPRWVEGVARVRGDGGQDE